MFERLLETITPLPNVFLIGASKCGTTWLANRLARHPNIFVPATKEPNFLLFEQEGRCLDSLELNDAQRHRLGSIEPTALERAMYEHSATTVDAYTRLYAEADAPIRIDASVRYLYSERAAGRIARWPLQTKLLVILRDPIERMWSQWQMARRLGIEPLSFEDALQAERDGLRTRWSFDWNYASHSRYDEHLSRYFGRIPSANLHCEIYEELFDDPRSGLERICRFLDVDFAPLADDDMATHLNAATHVRSRGVEQFANYYRPSWRKLIPLSIRQQIWRACQSLNQSKDKSAIPEDLRAELQGQFATSISRTAALLRKRVPWATSNGMTASRPEAA